MVVSGPKFARKISPTPLYQPECWHKAGWIHVFMFFMPNSDPIIWMLQLKSRISNLFRSICVNQCKLKPHFSVWDWHRWYPSYLNKAFLFWTNFRKLYWPCLPCIDDAFLKSSFCPLLYYNMPIVLLSDWSAPGWPTHTSHTCHSPDRAFLFSLLYQTDYLGISHFL